MGPCDIIAAWVCSPVEERERLGIHTPVHLEMLDPVVRRIEVLRMPRQARDTVQLAIDSVRRAAPFGDVSRLPRPWKFTETFLFNDDRRFKPRSLE